MPSYHIKNVIKDTSIKCSKAAVHGTFVPDIKFLVAGGFWGYMVNEIADEHNVTFDMEPIKFVETIAAGVGVYWGGCKQFSNFAYALFWGVCPPGAYIPQLGVVTNVILNAYFTWSVGHSMDSIFAANSGEEAGIEIAKQIIKAVCHVPSKNEFSEFWNDVSLSVSEIKSWFD